MALFPPPSSKTITRILPPKWCITYGFCDLPLPNGDHVEYIMKEAKELFAKTEQYAKLRYEGYKKLNEGK